MFDLFSDKKTEEDLDKIDFGQKKEKDDDAVKPDIDGVFKDVAKEFKTNLPKSIIESIFGK